MLTIAKRKTHVSPQVLDKQFWLLTFGLLAFWGLVIVSAASQKSPRQLASGDREHELKNANNCKALCVHCGGLGFYCGEECICECNDDNSDTECISTMQSNARKLKIPFEILIQGPSCNRFVRNAYQFEQNADRKSIVPPIAREVRNKRSTVVIYKPTAQNSLLGTCEQKLNGGLKLKKSIKKRSVEQSYGSSSKAEKLSKKRSVDRLDWFTDFASTLVRPAPLGGHKKEVEPARFEETVQHKRSTPLLDRSWFSDNTNLLLQPAPIFKRQSFDSEHSEEASGLAMQNLPKVLRDTISSIGETAINEDFGDALRSKIREGSEAFKSKLTDNSFDVFSKNLFSSDVGKKILKGRPSLIRTEAPTTMAPATSPPISMPKVSLPWFRPMRFLQRVQQSIN